MLANPTLLSSVPPPGLTVGELAALLYNAEPRTAVLAERIRGWTKQKLLAPISGERGTGKHFRYAASAVVFEVLLLNALANTGLHIASFGRPTPEERKHDFLWRIRRQLPRQGKLGVFDRSH